MACYWGGGGPSTKRTQYRYSRNVYLNLAYNTLWMLASSIMLGQILALYVASLPGNTENEVGYVSAISGLAMVIAALPAGYLSDKYARSKVLKVACGMNLLAAAFLLVALASDSMDWLYASGACIGAAGAATQGPLMALLSDSLESGAERTSLFVMQYALGLLASAIGPAIAMVMFWEASSGWNTDLLRNTMYAGTAVYLLSSVFLVGFDDSASLGAKSEAVSSSSSASKPRVLSTPTGLEAVNTHETEAAPVPEASQSLYQALPEADLPEGRTPALPQSINSGTHSSSVAAEAVDPRTKMNLGHQTINLGCVTLTVNAIPYIIFISDLVMCVGAGMTVQFFALFFKNDFELGPVPVAGIFAGAPVCIALFSLVAIPVSCARSCMKPGLPSPTFQLMVAHCCVMTVMLVCAMFIHGSHLFQHMSSSSTLSSSHLPQLHSLCLQLNKACGRAPMAVTWDAVGTLALFGMSFNANPLWLDISLYLVRTAAMNAGYPTQRAIMMDVVPKKDRGKWNSLESFTTFTWTGSAALGGYLITSHDYRYTFRLTGILYIIGTVVLCLLIPLTKGEVMVSDDTSGETDKKVEAEGLHALLLEVKAVDEVGEVAA